MNTRVRQRLSWILLACVLWPFSPVLAQQQYQPYPYYYDQDSDYYMYGQGTGTEADPQAARPVARPSPSVQQQPYAPVQPQQPYQYPYPQQQPQPYAPVQRQAPAAVPRQQAPRVPAPVQYPTPTYNDNDENYYPLYYHYY